MVGGPDYGESQFNRATHAKRQPGSSFKVYVYATALENGYTPNTIVRDASRPCGTGRTRTTAAVAAAARRMPLWEALAKSLNTVAVELSFAVGREKVIEMTQRLGITGVKKTCSMALGDYGITPLEHAGGVATLRQRRQARQALRHSRHRHLEGRPRLQPRPRRAARPPQVIKRAGRRRDELDAATRS